MSDALKYIPSLLAPALVSILLLPIGTHLFPVATYGNYVLAISALSLLQLVANAWVGSAIIRFYTVAAQDGDLQRLNSTSLVLILAQSAAGALICWLVVLAMRQRLESELFLLLMIVPVQMFASSLLVLPLHVLRARRQLGVYNVVSVAKTVLPVAGGVAASLLMGRSVVGMMAGSAAVMWALTPLGFGLCFGLRGRPAWRNYDRSWARKLLYFGAPLVPTLLMVEALDLSDRFIIGAYRGSVETGIYGASYSVAALSMQFITVLLVSAGAPLVVSIWETRGRESTETFLTFLTRLMILVGIPAVVGLSLLSRQVMILFSTPDYVQGAVIIPLVAAGGFLLGLQWIAQRGMMLANKTVRIMVLYSVAGLSNIIANLLLVPKMGYIAAAWTTFACYLLLLLLIALGSAPYLTWHVPILSVMRSLAGCLVMGLAILFIESLHLNSVFVEVLACVAVSVAIYGIVLTLTGELPAKRLLSLVRGREVRPADV